MGARGALHGLLAPAARVREALAARPRLDVAVRGLGLLVVYLALVGVGLLTNRQANGFAAAWPASGFMLAAAILSKATRWPFYSLLMLGGHVALTVAVLDRPTLLAFAFALTNVFQSTFGAGLVRLHVGERPDLRSMKQALSFLALGLALPIALSAAFATFATYAANPAVDPLRVFGSWALSSGTGVLVVGPLVLGYATKGPTLKGRAMSRGVRTVEAILLAVVLLAVCGLLFLTPLGTTSFPVHYLLYPVCLWAAMRFGLRGASSTSVCAYGLSTAAILAGESPLAKDWGVERTMQWMQVYLAILTSTSFVVAALREEWESARQAAEADERRYRTLVDLSPLPILVVSDGRIAYANAEAARRLGAESAQLLLRPLADLAPRGELVRLLEGAPLAEDGAVLAGQLVRLDTRAIEVEAALAPIRREGREATQVVLRDVTEERRAQDLREQTQKLESIGRLAGGVAHDFNNLLTAVIGHIDLAQSQLEADSEMRQDLDVARLAAERCAELSTQLLAFARRQITEPRSLDLGEVIGEAERLLRRAMGGLVVVKTELAPGSPTVHADPSQLTQVILNLALNARDAMPEGGVLTIRTTALRRYEAQADVPAGDYVTISVADTGHGMGEDVRAHLFEPFFTTKELGKGTGLGLATCYGIVKQTGGHIVVQSAVGKGTTFTIYLPPGRGAAAPRSGRQAAVPTGGSETILLVEDGDLVRQLASRVLGELGYRTLIATGGDEAIAIARSETHLDLLVTDVMMPRMSGDIVAERIRELHPGTPVLFITGHAEERLAPELPAHAVLMKPFTPAALATRVRRILDGRSREVSPSAA